FGDVEIDQRIGQNAADPLTDDRMIVDEKNASHACTGPSSAAIAEDGSGGSGRITITVVPPRTFLVMRTSPPTPSARSRMPSSPIVAGLSTSPGAMPRP